MAQYYRNQNESGRWQDNQRGGHRNVGGRDRHDIGGRERYETGNERRYSPDWGDRSFDAGQFDENSSGFEGDRSYSAGGYSEEFGHRREGYPGRDRDNHRFGEQHGQERFGGYYGRNQDYGSRDFDQSSHSGFGSRDQQYQRDPYRGEDFNRGRGGYYGSFGEQGSAQRSGFTGGIYSSHGTQGTFGRESGYGRQGSNEPWQSQQQSHRGRGPKGYERSDERLKEIICERLTDDPNIDASDITIEVNNKVVKLTGTVEDRRVKYLIEDVIEQAGGVRDIDNQLRVQQSGGGQSPQASSSQHGAMGSEGGYGTRGTDNKSSTQSSTPGMSPTKRN
jgi:osmotically-inducible protein OsmY